MILRYRISLPNIKGFARVYEIDAATSLYDFHCLLRDDLDFARDLLIQFKALDKSGSLVARYAMFDLGWGAVDTVSLAATVKKGVSQFIYFYDVTNKKNVIVTYEGEVEPREGAEYPVLVESVGPNPVEFENGYVAFVDLPANQRPLPPTKPDWSKAVAEDDDEDDDEDFDLDEGDEDEDDDEDGKEIYDGSEF